MKINNKFYQKEIFNLAELKNDFLKEKKKEEYSKGS